MISRIRARRRRRILLALLTGWSNLDFVRLARLAQVSGLALASHLDRLEHDGWVMRTRRDADYPPTRVYQFTVEGLAGAGRELGFEPADSTGVDR